MKRLVFFMIIILSVSTCFILAENKNSKKRIKEMQVNFGSQSVLDFSLKDIDGKETGLMDYKGKVILIVNVASKCGFTPQYKQLEAVYEKYKDRGFVILGFPADNFLHQEPGDDAQIKSFCSLTYGVTFPMFSKISVAGKDIHPLYQFLTDKATDPGFAGKITWNFNKFLIDKNGKIVDRFDSKIKPDDNQIISKIEQLLAEK